MEQEVCVGSGWEPVLLSMQYEWAPRSMNPPLLESAVIEIIDSILLI